jgi:hypothetical protein
MFQSVIKIKLKYILIKSTYVIFITIYTCKRACCNVGTVERSSTVANVYFVLLQLYTVPFGIMSWTTGN